MSNMVFSFPGKAGDALMQWPIAYWWAKEKGEQFICWMDEKSTKLVAPLFAAQPCVKSIEYRPGITHYACGGQPWHFGAAEGEYNGYLVHHLGFRTIPQRQLTLETLNNAQLGLSVTQDTLASIPTLEVEAEVTDQRICLLHGQPIYGHTRRTPQFWKFLSDHADDLEKRFDRIIFVGDQRDREVGLRTYPTWETFDDHGNFLNLAKLMKASKLVIGVGSSVVSLAGALKVPSVRVHDPIGDLPKVLWSNLQKNHLNLTEIDLRDEWPGWVSQFPLEEAKVG